MTDAIWPFLAATILFVMAPGPDVFYVVTRTIAQGRMVGFASSLGVSTGAAIHILAAAFGFSVVIQTSATAYALLKYAGAAYLVWLGVQALRQKAIRAENAAGPKRSESLGAVYLQGVIVDVCNPKVALFFLAFLPQFIPAGTASPVLSFLLLGAGVIVIGLIWEAVLVLFSDRVMGRFLRNSRAVRYLNRGMGAAFITLALNLVFSDKPLPARS